MTIESSKKDGNWSGAEIKAFLLETLFPLRISVASGSGPVVVPLWFQDIDGYLLSCSPTDSQLVTKLQKQAQVAFSVSTNDLPYHCTSISSGGYIMITVAE